MFKRYKEVRVKYYNETYESDPSKGEGLFNQSSTFNDDPIALTFYASATLDEAFNRLQHIVILSELSFLKDFYKHFESRYRVFIKDCEKFNTLVQNERAKLNTSAITAYLEKVASFYGVKEKVTFRVVHTWFPPIDKASASVCDNCLILPSYPTYYPQQEQSDIVLHEIIHIISRQQAITQKQDLTKTFLALALPGLPSLKYNILEEPLAVVFGQMLYLELFDQVKFKDESVKDKWYQDTWINEYAKAIYPQIKETLLCKQVLDQKLIKKLVQSANALLSKNQITPNTR